MVLGRFDLPDKCRNAAPKAFAAPKIPRPTITKLMTAKTVIRISSPPMNSNTSHHLAATLMILSQVYPTANNSPLAVGHLILVNLRWASAQVGYLAKHCPLLLHELI